MPPPRLRGLLLGLLALPVASEAVAATPVPRQPTGAVTRPSTAAAGTLDGRRFRVVSAIVQRDWYGVLNLYLFARPRGCGQVSGADAPYLWVSVDTSGAPLRIGRGTSTGAGTHVVANVESTPPFTDAAVLTFLHVDPVVGSSWTGSVMLVDRANRRLASVRGGFVARWCGSG